MSNIEFLNFIPTPNEKHLGIATVRLDKRIVLRYKIVQIKDGSGSFPVASSYKISDENGERYIPAFMLDSNFEKEEVENVIKTNIKRYMANGSTIPVKGHGFVHGRSDGVKVQEDENAPF